MLPASFVDSSHPWNDGGDLEVEDPLMAHRRLSSDRLSNNEACSGDFSYPFSMKADVLDVVSFSVLSSIESSF